MTCKVKGKKVKCTVAQSTKRHTLRWRLTRAGHTVRHGATASTTGSRLDLGNLARGRYLLHVQGQKGVTRLVVS